MIISVEQIKMLKRVPNSVYNRIKPEFLYHINKLEGSTFTKLELEALILDQRVMGDHPLNDLLESVNSGYAFDYMVDTLGQGYKDASFPDSGRRKEASHKHKNCNNT